MRVALAVGAVLAVSCIGFETAYAAAEENSTATMIDNMKRLTERVEEMEQSRELDQRRIRELEEKLKSDPSPRASEQQDSDEGTQRAEQTDPLEEAVSQDLWSRNVGRGVQLRLLDIGLDILVNGGYSSVDDDITAELQGGAHEPFRRGFSFSQLEFAIRGAIDPYFRGEVYVHFQLDAEGETIVELEEAFATSQILPFALDEKGFEIEAGTFFTEFGRKNPTHPHTWYWVDQPFVNSRMFGGDGLRGPGIRIGWLTPLPWYSEVHWGMQNAQGETQISFLANGEIFEERPNDEIFEERRPIGGRPFANPDVDGLEDFTYLVRWANAFDPSDEWSLLLGASALFGPNSTGSSASTMIFGGDITAKWHPLQTDRGWPYLRITTEFMYRNYEAAAFSEGTISLPKDTLDDWGIYTELIWGFMRGWSAGIRYEYGDASGANYDEGREVSHDSDPYRDRRHRVSPVLVWDPSEYSRIRLQYNYDHAQHLKGDTSHAVWLGLEFSLGGHPAHEY
jgi:hypothetical protein